jgi:hypothetical protein
MLLKDEVKTDDRTLAEMIAKEKIRDLVHLYSRGVDRKDIALLRTLYAKGGTDDHGDHFSGSADDYIEFLAQGLPHMHVSNHCVCNHLIAIEGDEGYGEVYAIAYHLYPDGRGGTTEDIAVVRYNDHYVQEDGRWKFASRVVVFDQRSKRSVPSPAPFGPPEKDPSHNLRSRIFARGPRA